MEKANNRFSPEALRRNQPCPHLDFRLLTFRIIRQYVCVVLNHKFAVIYYSRKRQLIKTEAESVSAQAWDSASYRAGAQ